MMVVAAGMSTGVVAASFIERGYSNCFQLNKYKNNLCVFSSSSIRQQQLVEAQETNQNDSNIKSATTPAFRYNTKRDSDEDQEEKLVSLKDYLNESNQMMMISGGSPRGFSPLECRSQAHLSPLLLFLPGIDGIGLGLLLHHQRLGKIFDIWCLHIPITDRTPFTDLVRMVERTVRSESSRLPDRPIYLVAESVGACLALSVAARNPDIDLVLILANPATSFGKSPLQPLLPLLQIMPKQLYQTLPYALASLTGIPLKLVMDTLEKGLPFQEAAGEISESLGALSSYLQVLADCPLPGETLMWKLQMLKDACTYANSRLHAVKAQTLVLSSGRDLLFPSEEEGERLRKLLPKCEIRRFSDSGHALFLNEGFDLVTTIKGASFYRRARSLDYVSDYMPPTDSEFEQVAENLR